MPFDKLPGRAFGPRPSAAASSETTRLRVVEGGQGRPRRRRFALPSEAFVTYGMLVLICVIFACMYAQGHGAITTEVARAWGAKDNDLIRAGQYWRFVTPIFLHGSPIHLLVNSLSLIMLGAQIEMIYGWRKYLLVYLAGGLAGNVFSFLLSPVPSLGASGALFGLIGAGIVFPLRFKSLIRPRVREIILRQLVTVAVINLAIGFSPGSGVDNWAHLGGMAGGGFAALFLLPDALATEEQERKSSRAVSLATLVAVLIVGACGIAQARWDLQQPTQIPLDTYPFGTGQPWGSIGIPRGWKNSGSLWLSPSRAVVYLEAVPPDSPLPAQQQAELKENGVKVSRFILDGKPAAHVFLIDRRTSLVLELYWIQAFGQTVILHMECPSHAYAATQPDFERIARSLRITHAPAPLPEDAGKGTDSTE